jgi:hypothetical protein
MPVTAARPGEALPRPPEAAGRTSLCFAVRTRQTPTLNVVDHLRGSLFVVSSHDLCFGSLTVRVPNYLAQLPTMGGEESGYSLPRRRILLEAERDITLCVVTFTSLRALLGCDAREVVHRRLLGNDFGILGLEVEQVGLVRTRLAITDGVSNHDRHEPKLQRIERAGANTATR